ncbi:MAG TPA: redoxin domain-containing protein [Bdellovibrionota bacterium]|jgi:peroxiredoxin
MTGNPRLKWYAMAVALILTCGGGLMLGKLHEKDYMGALYERRDFTLLDDQGEFFRLNSLPEKKLALLVFTPDGIPLDAVKPFAEFSRHLENLQSRGIEPFLVSRTNREIVRNFKRATGFGARFLVDAGGAVGRITGIWSGAQLSSNWGYSLVDRDFRVLWSATSDEPMSYARLMEELKKAR